MQTNEEKCFTAIFRDVTKEEASDLCNHPKWTAGAWGHALDQRDDARHEVEKLRAQADARPVDQWQWRWKGDEEWRNSTKENCDKALKNAQGLFEVRALYTHPEASATGLSSREILAAARAYVQPYGWLKFPSGAEFVELVQSLTRASAATVAEPSDWKLDECVATGQTCTYGPHGRHGETQCKYCGAKPAAQQQAQPGADERAAMPPCDDRRPYDTNDPDGFLESDREWIERNLGAVRWFIDNHAAVRAAQSGQRAGEEFQARVQPWMLACFGPEIAADAQERNHRFLEEALELVQACGATASEAHQLVDYVYGRPVGDKHQEIGGVMVTLAALCLAQGQNMHAAGETELARIWTKVEQIRAKQAAKPKHSPLPEHPVGQRAGVVEGWKLVPEQPTKTMLDAAERLDWSNDDVRGNCCNQWNAMLAAAPTQQQEGE